MEHKNSRDREDAIKKSAKRNQRRRRARRIRILTALFILLILTGIIILSYTVLFPVKSISVSGKTKYTEAQIIEASDIQIDNNLFALKTKNIAEKIEKKLPYISKVKVQRILPDKVKLIVEPTEVEYSYLYNGSYYLTNSSHKLLEKASQPKEGSVVISGAAVSSENIGQKLEFKDNQTAIIIKNLISGLKARKIKISSINVDDPLNLIAVVEDRITVKFGSSSDLESKIAHLKATLDQMGENERGTYDLSTWSSSNPVGYFVKDTSTSRQ